MRSLLFHHDEGVDFLARSALGRGPAAHDPHGPTATSPGPAGPAAPVHDETPGSSAFEHGRFVPGTILADRYRIVGLLGRGGMGEVYRADDLTLGQSVALKFLPEQLARDPGYVSRFTDEVRLAREVSHAHVCRVHDIGDANGLRFLSMEYVDGENLAYLLRRIGRFPVDRAADMARQLCHGLAAAHEKGVLHRDLKPANIMIDGRGRVRITDFGLATPSDRTPLDVRSGTPAYMAPEQLAGEEVTVRSDIYALGLVLYELFTGQAVYDESAFNERLERPPRVPVSPTHLVPELDRAGSEVILRCLDPEPVERPASALAVAAAFPGRDPLEAALAAGETPSPDLVKAAGEEGALTVREAAAWLGVFLVAIAIAIGLSPLVPEASRVRLGSHPQVLVNEARRVADLLLDRGSSAGKGADAVRESAPSGRRDSAFGFAHDAALFGSAPEGDRLSDLARSEAISFWYRESPDFLLPSGGFPAVVTETDPPPIRAGMMSVRLDVHGRLLELRSRLDRDGLEESASDVSWPDVFEPRLVGVDLRGLDTTTPQLTPPVPHDATAAWRLPGEGTGASRIEAATYLGRPVWFRVLRPWHLRSSRAEQAAGGPGEASLMPNTAFWDGLVLVLVVVGAFFARRNLVRERCDRRGAFRLAVFVFAAHVLVWLFRAHHVPNLAFETQRLWTHVLDSLAWAFVLWLLYLALEPPVRKRWPQTLISWSRLLSGRLRDALVGRDVLAGVALGVGVLSIGQIVSLAESWIGDPVPPSDERWLDALLGPRHMVGLLLYHVMVAVAGGLIWLLVLLLFRGLLRVQWLVGLVFVTIMTLGLAIGRDTVSEWVVCVLHSSSVFFLLTRFGLLAAMGLALSFTLFHRFFIWTDATFAGNLGAWHSASALFSWAVLVGLALAAFAVATFGASTGPVPAWVTPPPRQRSG